MVAIAGNFDKGTFTPTDWRISAHSVKDGSLLGTTVTTGTTYSITCSKALLCNVSAEPKIDYNWTANRSVIVGEYIVPNSPDTTPRIFKATTVTGANGLYAQSVLLLRGEGTSGSTTFTDLSTTPKTVTVNGTVQVNTLQLDPWGTHLGVIYNGGSGNWLDIASTTALDVTSVNWGIGFFFQVTSASTRQALCGRGTSGGNTYTFFLEVTAAGVLKGWPDISHSITGTTSITANVMHHAYMCRQGDTCYLFLNGNLEGTVAVSGALTESATKFSIGRVGEYSGIYTTGYFSNFELYIGGTGYPTTSFTPPTFPFRETTYSLTGAIEPTWPSSGTVNESSSAITWTYVADLDDGMFKYLGTKNPV